MSGVKLWDLPKTLARHTDNFPANNTPNSQVPTFRVTPNPESCHHNMIRRFAP